MSILSLIVFLIIFGGFVCSLFAFALLSFCHLLDDSKMNRLKDYVTLLDKNLFIEDNKKVEADIKNKFKKMNFLEFDFSTNQSIKSRNGVIVSRDDFLETFIKVETKHIFGLIKDERTLTFKIQI